MLDTSLIERFASENPAVKAALIAAVVSLATSLFTLVAAVLSGPVKYWFDNKSLTAKLRAEYRQKNLAELQDLMRRYKGLLLEGAESLNYRFWNLYKNESERWMHVSGDYPGPDYYFRSWVTLLVRVIATATAFENEAIYIDQAIANETDFQFIYMIKSWSYALSNVNLFDNIPYDKGRQYDHLYRGTVRCIGEVAWREGRFISDRELEKLIHTDRDVRSLCSLLDGINSSEDRLRWDRLVCFHILLLIFLNTFGYEIHRTSKAKVAKVIGQIKHPQMKTNLKDLLDRWHLRKSKAGELVCNLLEKIADGPATNLVPHS